MKAIGYSDAGLISAKNSLVEFRLDVPQLDSTDLLV